VKTSLAFGHVGDSGFLEEVAFDVGSSDSLVRAEKDLNVLPESARILISYCFAVPEGFEEGVASQNLFFEGVLPLLVLAEVGQHLHAILGRFCLSRPRLS
jgi:hypothetical protein